jgi:hypothetical protein
MKKLLLFGMVISMAVSTIAQNRVLVPKEVRDRAVKAGERVVVINSFEKVPGVPAYKGTNLVDEDIIGGTRYDLQTNSSIQNRMHVFEDGTIGAIWTMGLQDAAYPDRGTGYNYFDGNAWGDEPEERIESIRTGWPSYAPYGENGEMVVSHDFSAGSLYYLTRTEKGTGDWTEDEFVGPNNIQISWNRSTTSGVDNSVMQLLYITWPEANGGPIYEGMDGALLYSRSSDGGASWDYEHELLDGMTADNYLGISADNYEWAASNGDNIAFLVGDFWTDLFLMKSADGGDTWTKTVIWENPYPLFDFTTPTDTFHCSDGTHHLAFDSQNKIHVVFGINRTYSDGSTWYYYPGEDGIGYWNEDMPTFSNNLNALNPYGHPDSELEEDYNLIGWIQDMDGDGEITLADDWGAYNVGLNSQPQIVVDDMDYIYVVWSGVTETYDNGALNYRHLWSRGSWGEGVWGNFELLTSDLIHIFDECVFPSVASFTDDYFYLVYQTDNEPGMSVQGTLTPVTDNNTTFMKVARNELIPIGIEEQSAVLKENQVSQNQPNPFRGTTYVSVEVTESCTLSLEVSNLAGQMVYAIPSRDLVAGTYRFGIDARDLTPGVYFYTVKADGSSVTKKMIVE